MVHLCKMPDAEHEGAILAANDTFYRAFSLRDADAMDELWARSHPVACIHPGWPVLSGRSVVMESWRRVLENPHSPRISCLHAKVHRLGDVAFVTCFESVQGALLSATNVFVLEDGEWTMAHHQAGPVADDALESDDEPDPRSLN